MEREGKGSPTYTYVLFSGVQRKMCGVVGWGGGRSCGCD